MPRPTDDEIRAEIEALLLLLAPPTDLALDIELSIGASRCIHTIKWATGTVSSLPPSIRLKALRDATLRANDVARGIQR